MSQMSRMPMSAISKVPRPAENEFFSKFDFHTQIIAHNSAWCFFFAKKIQIISTRKYSIWSF